VNKNYIILNGKHYDAVTGALIKPAASHSQATHTRITHAPAARGKLAVKDSSAAAKAVKHAQKSASRAHHGSPQHIRHHKPEQSKTLMRKVVNKPGHQKLPTVKKAYPVQKASSAIALKTPVHRIDASRSHRAQDIHKSKQVSKFATVASVAVPTKIQPVALKPAPAHTSVTTPRTSHAHKAHKSPQEKKTELLEKALANAKSHEQPAAVIKHRSKRRLFSSMAGLAAVLVVVGFVAYMNKASVELQLASVRAGFQASLPNYTPTGYERQSAQAADGKVAISFLSPAQHSNFTLTQESSSWDSQTLFDSIVAQENTTYQTVQSNGRTIYLYGGDKAAWVDGGILYKVDGNAKLNSDQVISLATSM